MMNASLRVLASKDSSMALETISTIFTMISLLMRILVSSFTSSARLTSSRCSLIWSWVPVLGGIGWDRVGLGGIGWGWVRLGWI